VGFDPSERGESSSEEVGDCICNVMIKLIFDIRNRHTPTFHGGWLTGASPQDDLGCRWHRVNPTGCDMCDFGVFGLWTMVRT